MDLPQVTLEEFWAWLEGGALQAAKEKMEARRDRRLAFGEQQLHCKWGNQLQVMLEDVHKDQLLKEQE